MNTTQNFASCPAVFMPLCEYPQSDARWAVRIAYAVLDEAYGMAHQCMEVPEAEALVEEKKQHYKSVWGEEYALHNEKCRDVYLVKPCEDNPRLNRMIKRCNIP